MTELQRYLAEEVAEDHADGIITRREAMRRLGLLGVAGAAATALLAAFGAARGPGRPRGHGRRIRAADAFRRVGARRHRGDHVRRAERHADGRLGAGRASRAGGVLVIHENRGLNDHIRKVAGRFAAGGYRALALDLLSEEGGTGSFPDEAAVAAALGQIPPERFDADMKAGVTELKRRVRGQEARRDRVLLRRRHGVAAARRRASRASPRRRRSTGRSPRAATSTGIKAAVLGVYGGLDARVNATRDAAQAALDAARLRHEILTFTEADHAFFNDTGARFNAQAAAEAWRRVLNWFDD